MSAPESTARKRTALSLTPASTNSKHTHALFRTFSHKQAACSSRPPTFAGALAPCSSCAGRQTRAHSRGKDENAKKKKAGTILELGGVVPGACSVAHMTRSYKELGWAQTQHKQQPGGERYTSQPTSPSHPATSDHSQRHASPVHINDLPCDIAGIR